MNLTNNNKILKKRLLSKYAKFIRTLVPKYIEKAFEYHFWECENLYNNLRNVLIEPCSCLKIECTKK
jgi:hypothetical protein